MELSYYFHLAESSFGHLPEVPARRSKFSHPPEEPSSDAGRRTYTSGKQHHDCLVLRGAPEEGATGVGSMTSLRPFDMPSSPVLKQRQMGGVKKIERACCLTLTYLPLVFVYGLTTWAVWVEASIGFEERRPRWTGM